MPSSMLITSVDHTTDQMTIAGGHGLTTGDGFLAVFTPDGELPEGLGPAIDYWAIVDDPDTFRLALSSSEALAGEAVDITSNGSGELRLLRGLPYRRERTYVPKEIDVAGSRVRSSDLNAIQDALVALWSWVTGQAQMIFTSLRLPVDQNAHLQGEGRYYSDAEDSVTLTPHDWGGGLSGWDEPITRDPDGTMQFTGAGAIYASLSRLPAGVRIKRITVMHGTAGGDVSGTMVLRSVYSGDVNVIASASTTMNGLFTTGPLDLIPAEPEDFRLGGDVGYQLQFISDVGGLLGNVKIDYDRSQPPPD